MTTKVMGLRAGRVCIRIEAQQLTADEERELEYVFTGFATEPPAEPARVRLVPDAGGGFVVIDNGVPRQRAPVAADLINDVARKVHRYFRESDTGLLFIHASIVGAPNADRAAALMARTESGKSTLTYELARRGMVYLGDDMAAWDIERKRWVAYPRPITLRDSSFGLWEPRPAGVLWDDGQLLYTHPWREFAADAKRAAEREYSLAALVHCSHRADLAAPCSLAQRPTEEAYGLLRRLVWTSPSLGGERTRQELRQLGESMPLYRLFSRDLAASADAVQQLLVTGS